MALAKIKSDEETLIEFDVQVYGTTEQLSEVRFIIEGKKYDIVCKCESTDTGGVRVTVPKLKGIFESGEYQCKIETIIQDKIFTPLNESIEVLPLVEFDVKAKTINTVKAPTIKVGKVKTAISIKNKSLNEAIEAGAVQENIEGAIFLKQDGVYVGIVVNENKILSAGTGFETPEALVEAFGNNV